MCSRIQAKFYHSGRDQMKGSSRAITRELMFIPKLGRVKASGRLGRELGIVVGVWVGANGAVATKYVHSGPP